MLNRSTIFLGLMLTGTLATAAWVSQDGGADGAAIAAPAMRHMNSSASARSVQSSMPALQLDRLVRTEVVEPEQDPFASKTWYVPPPPPPSPVKKVQEEVRPTAPPLPFGYMGRMQEEDGHEVVYLTQGSRVISVSAGDTIEGVYHLDSVSSGQLVLTYLPLNARQTLNTGGSSTGGMATAGAAPIATAAPLPVVNGGLP